MECRETWVVCLLLCLSAIPGCQPATETESPAPDDALTELQQEEPQSARSSIPSEWRVEGSREWRHIVIHHTATSQGSVESIHETHLKRKDNNGNPWMGIGYHFVIGNGDGMDDGAIEPTFRWREQLHGAHAGNNEYNQHGIGVVLVGNFEKTSPSTQQLSAVKRLVTFLKEEYHIPAEQIVGHDEVKTTACPGQFFPLAEVRESTLTTSANRTTELIAGIKETDIRN